MAGMINSARMMVSTMYISAGPGHHPNRQQIVGCARHHITGRIAIVEFGGQTLEMLVELVA